MKAFERDNLNNKQNYYKVLIVIEVLLLVSLFCFNLNWILIFFALPILCIDLYSNKRCLDRQRNFIKYVEFNNKDIICIHLNDKRTVIPFKNAKFSIREVKFEKDKIEIEIKQKVFLKSKLVGRLHISNWSSISEIKKEFLKNTVTQVKYRPEGFWSKYGILMADVVITSASLAMSELPVDINNLEEIVFPISDIKESIKPTVNKGNESHL